MQHLPKCRSAIGEPQNSPGWIPVPPQPSHGTPAAEEPSLGQFPLFLTESLQFHCTPKKPERAREEKKFWGGERGQPHTHHQDLAGADPPGFLIPL